TDDPNDPTNRVKLTVTPTDTRWLLCKIQRRLKNDSNSTYQDVTGGQWELIDDMWRDVPDYYQFTGSTNHTEHDYYPANGTTPASTNQDKTQGRAYDNGTITNKLVGKVKIKVTKLWQSIDPKFDSYNYPIADVFLYANVKSHAENGDYAESKTKYANNKDFDNGGYALLEGIEPTDPQNPDYSGALGELVNMLQIVYRHSVISVSRNEANESGVITRVVEGLPEKDSHGVTYTDYHAVEVDEYGNEIPINKIAGNPIQSSVTTVNGQVTVTVTKTLPDSNPPAYIYFKIARKAGANGTQEYVPSFKGQENYLFEGKRTIVTDNNTVQYRDGTDYVKFTDDAEYDYLDGKGGVPLDKYDENGALINYSIKERAINGYTYHISNDTIINEYNGGARVQVKVTKNWRNMDAAAQFPTIKFTLHQCYVGLERNENGQFDYQLREYNNFTQTIRASNSEPVSYVFGAHEKDILYQYSPTGQEFFYYVTEELIDGSGQGRVSFRKNYTVNQATKQISMPEIMTYTYDANATTEDKMVLTNNVELAGLGFTCTITESDEDCFRVGANGITMIPRSDAVSNSNNPGLLISAEYQNLAQLAQGTYIVEEVDTHGQTVNSSTDLTVEATVEANSRQAIQIIRKISEQKPPEKFCFRVLQSATVGDDGTITVPTNQSMGGTDFTGGTVYVRIRNLPADIYSVSGTGAAIVEPTPNQYGKVTLTTEGDLTVAVTLPTNPSETVSFQLMKDTLSDPVAVTNPSAYVIVAKDADGQEIKAVNTSLKYKADNGTITVPASAASANSEGKFVTTVKVNNLPAGTYSVSGVTITEPVPQNGKVTLDTVGSLTLTKTMNSAAIVSFQIMRHENENDNGTAVTTDAYGNTLTAVDTVTGEDIPIYKRVDVTNDYAPREENFKSTITVTKNWNRYDDNTRNPLNKEFEGVSNYHFIVKRKAKNIPENALFRLDTGIINSNGGIPEIKIDSEYHNEDITIITSPFAGYAYNDNELSDIYSDEVDYYQATITIRRKDVYQEPIPVVGRVEKHTKQVNIKGLAIYAQNGMPYTYTVDEVTDAQNTFEPKLRTASQPITPIYDQSILLEQTPTNANQPLQFKIQRIATEKDGAVYEDISQTAIENDNITVVDAAGGHTFKANAQGEFSIPAVFAEADGENEKKFMLVITGLPAMDTEGNNYEYQVDNGKYLVSSDTLNGCVNMLITNAVLKNSDIAFTFHVQRRTSENNQFTNFTGNGLPDAVDASYQAHTFSCDVDGVYTVPKEFIVNRKYSVQLNGLPKGSADGAYAYRVIVLSENDKVLSDAELPRTEGKVVGGTVTIGLENQLKTFTYRLNKVFGAEYKDKDGHIKYESIEPEDYDLYFREKDFMSRLRFMVQRTEKTNPAETDWTDYMQLNVNQNNGRKLITQDYGNIHSDSDGIITMPAGQTAVLVQGLDAYDANGNPYTFSVDSGFTLTTRSADNGKVDVVVRKTGSASSFTLKHQSSSTARENVGGTLTAVNAYVSDTNGQFTIPAADAVSDGNGNKTFSVLTEAVPAHYTYRLQDVSGVPAASYQLVMSDDTNGKAIATVTANSNASMTFILQKNGGIYTSEDSRGIVAEDPLTGNLYRPDINGSTASFTIPAEAIHDGKFRVRLLNLDRNYSYRLNSVTGVANSATLNNSTLTLTALPSGKGMAELAPSPVNNDKALSFHLERSIDGSTNFVSVTGVMTATNPHTGKTVTSNSNDVFTIPAAWLHDGSFMVKISGLDYGFTYGSTNADTVTQREDGSLLVTKTVPDSNTADFAFTLRRRLSYQTQDTDYIALDNTNNNQKAPVTAIPLFVSDNNGQFTVPAMDAVPVSDTEKMFSVLVKGLP
ncbi:MAG: Cna B-type domain-containing protein, partial [Acutalibacteraceae bacterium]|nr:Cna B-type domain-containing protein [Acutalibacteraceae bacterium]